MCMKMKQQALNQKKLSISCQGELVLARRWCSPVIAGRLVDWRAPVSGGHQCLKADCAPFALCFLMVKFKPSFDSMVPSMFPSCLNELNMILWAFIDALLGWRSWAFQMSLINPNMVFWNFLDLDLVIGPSYTSNGSWITLSFELEFTSPMLSKLFSMNK